MSGFEKDPEFQIIWMPKQEDEEGEDSMAKPTGNSGSRPTGPGGSRPQPTSPKPAGGGSTGPGGSK